MPNERREETSLDPLLLVETLADQIVNDYGMQAGNRPQHEEGTMQHDRQMVRLQDRTENTAVSSSAMSNFVASSILDTSIGNNVEHQRKLHNNNDNDSNSNNTTTELVAWSSNTKANPGGDEQMAIIAEVTATTNSTSSSEDKDDSREPKERKERLSTLLQVHSNAKEQEREGVAAAVVVSRAVADGTDVPVRPGTGVRSYSKKSLGSNTDSIAQIAGGEEELRNLGATASSSFPPSRKRRLRSPDALASANRTANRRLRKKSPPDGNLSGSSTETGYAGSASSNESGIQQSSSSPSASSEEEGPSTAETSRSSITKKYGHSKHLDSSSSEIADFSSSTSRSNTDANLMTSAFSSPDWSEGDSEEPRKLGPLAVKLQNSKLGRRLKRPMMSSKKAALGDPKVTSKHSRASKHQSMLKDNYNSAVRANAGKSKRLLTNRSSLSVARAGGSRVGRINHKPPIFSLSCDTMAHCLAFLDPPEVHTLLTMPLSKEWRGNFTMPQDLWRVLCLTHPFKAKFEAEEQDSSDDSSFLQVDMEMKHLLGRYRLLYTSFVRCMRYLARIKEDAVNGRPPSVIDYGTPNMDSTSLRSNESLKSFLARARGVVVNNKRRRMKEQEVQSEDSNQALAVTSNSEVEGPSISIARKKTRKKKKEKERKIKFGHSDLTLRLLGPSQSGQAGNVNLPWSCAIYSIVNWMVAFTDVEGIQTMCMKVLPFLLEDESQRTTAQRAGLTDIVLRGMVLFPDSVDLHTAAFHTIVLLARPLGGREGMLFHCSMVNSSGIFNKESRSGKNGIAVMLDSMRRFQTDEVLQAMSCWSLVNIALAPSQKAVLVKLGGISVVANAMLQHPFNAEVQFRSLFALINLVIPSVNLSEENSPESRALQEQLGEVNETSEREMLDESVGQIANLVVVAMKNFCSSESILNRACLVLHNLSLTQDYHTTLLWTPNCYQMLEWCLANYRTDQVLQQSAAGTLHRLQSTLSTDEDLRSQFASSLSSQQLVSLEPLARDPAGGQGREPDDRSPRRP